MTLAPDNIVIFDRVRLRRNRTRCVPALAAHDFLLRRAGEQILDRLGDVRRDFSNVLQIGLRSDSVFSEALRRTAKAGNVFSMDVSEKLARNVKGPGVCGDDEFMPFRDSSLDLIVNLMNLHSTNDLPGALIQIKRALKPDGLFLAAMLGGETLHELRAALTATEINLRGGISPRVFPFADKPQMGALLQRGGFALPVVDSEIVTVTYGDMFGLLKDLRGMGEGNIIASRDKTFPGRNFFAKADEYYRAHFAEADGRIRATFEIIFLIGWTPHESQQKPLRPGSAKNRLADALHTVEIKSGIKAGEI